ncbi:MAG TPA: GAF domain-containing sensor histidine kinase [Candidatus Binatia bacterium]
MPQRMLVQKTRELQTLVEINRAIAGSSDRQALFSRIAAEAKTLFELDGVVIRLIDGGELACAAYAGRKELARPRTESLGGQSLGAAIAGESRAVAVGGGARDGAAPAAYLKFIARLGCRSMIGAPVKSGDRVIGALIGLGEKEREFHAGQIDFWIALADQAAIAAGKCALAEEAARRSDEVARARAETEQAHRAKATFMSAVSHELRTPLQVIIGSADLLKDGIVGQTKEEQARFLGAIAHHAEMLDGMIGKVLMVAKSDAKQTKLDISTAGIEEVMQNVLRYADRTNRNNRLEFAWTADGEIPPLTTDVAKLEEILKNLVSNACKFTLKGRIDVRVADRKSKKRVEFSVADTGIGIEEGDRETIFDEFYQARQSQQTEQGGIGLGLAIVKRYLALLQGDIRVESRPGKGTTFTFSLPYSI